MSETIVWTSSINVSGGPQISIKQEIPIEAFDSIKVAVPKKVDGTAGVTNAKIQPGGKGKIKFLSMTSSKYDAGVTFKVEGGNTEIKFDQPFVLLGQGGISLFQTDINGITFTNNLGSDIEVTVLVGRDAIQ